MERTLIGERLVDEGSITVLQLRAGLAWQRARGGKLGEALLDLGYLEEPVLVGALARHLGLPVVEVVGRAVPAEVLGLVPEGVLRRRRVLPVALAGGALVVATADPLDAAALEEVARASGLGVRAALAAERDIEEALSRHLGPPRSAAGGARASLALG